MSWKKQRKIVCKTRRPTPIPTWHYTLYSHGTSTKTDKLYTRNELETCSGATPVHCSREGATRAALVCSNVFKCVQRRSNWFANAFTNVFKCIQRCPNVFTVLLEFVQMYSNVFQMYSNVFKRVALAWPGSPNCLQYLAKVADSAGCIDTCDFGIVIPR